MPMEPPGGISERILAQDAPRAQLPHPARTRSTARPHTRAARAARRDRAIRPGLRPRQRRQPVRRHARAGIPRPLPGRGLPGVASCDSDSGGSSRRRIRGGASIRATCSPWPPSPRSAFTPPAKPSTTARGPTAASTSWPSWPACSGWSCSSPRCFATTACRNPRPPARSRWHESPRAPRSIRLLRRVCRSAGGWRSPLHSPPAWPFGCRPPYGSDCCRLPGRRDRGSRRFRRHSGCCRRCAPLALPLPSKCLSSPRTMQRNSRDRGCCARREAWCVRPPAASAGWGLPVTSTGMLKLTRASRGSPAPQASPSCGPPTIHTPRTCGAAAWLPSTLWLPVPAMAGRPGSPIGSVPATLRMCPPLKNSSVLARVIPSGSLSSSCTMQRNRTLLHWSPCRLAWR